MKTIPIIASLALLGPASIALEIPLKVEEPIGVARSQGPVSSGICFPKGLVPAQQVFSLFEGNRELSVQVTPLVVEPDGRLRWALLDFKCDLGAHETKEFVLRAQQGQSAQRNSLRVTQSDEALAIHTGPVEMTISKTKPFAPFAMVRANGKTVVEGGAVEWVDAKTDARLRAGVPKRIALEYQGPVRATVRVEGEYEGTGGGRLSYLTRITAWGGSTAIRIQHILANSNPDQVNYANIKSANLTFNHAMGPGAEALLGAGGLKSPLTPGVSAWLHQGKENRYYREPIRDAGRAGIGTETQWTGADSSGWLAVRGGGNPLLVCDRDFTGDPPRRLNADARQIVVEFMSEQFREGRGVPFRSDHAWLYDLSHKTADLWIDFAATGDLAASAAASRARLMAFAPGSWYSDCDAFGIGPFGTLEDEKNVYRQWGWKFDEKQLPKRAPMPGAFVRWEDNHYESEADSAEALLLMAIRTGQRGFFDEGEAWARYHANLHAWRTDGWVYDDGAIWFPQGGPLGTKPARQPPAFKYQHWGKGSGDDQELWHLVQAKSCYCHFYGAGLVDAFLLTGERDFLEAALDLAEQKNSEWRKHRQFAPGKTKIISDTRGFGRGFYVIMRVLEAQPDNPLVRDLVKLARDVLWNAELDERGFAPSHLGTGFGGFDLKRDLPAEMRAFMEKEGIAIDDQGWLTDRAGHRWPVVCLGGTWQHYYIAAAAERYARIFDDEDLRDFTEAFGRFAAQSLLSEKCRQTPYYAYMDVPLKGQPWDPWKFVPPHTTTTDGDGCVHEGYYTRFFPDCIVKAYEVCGAPGLLERAREFWHYGSKRGYRTKTYSAGRDAVGMFATHTPPKDDTVLSVSRMFHAWTHPRQDPQPPAAIRDLEVTLLGNGRAEVRFTAPADAGGGKVARYQVKCAGKPIVAYEDFEFARDDGLKRNYWRAANVSGEPLPGAPGTVEKFVVTGVPDLASWHFVVASYDTAGNRSPLSNSAAIGGNRE